MKPVFEPEYLALLAQIAELCKPDQRLYLVGGAVRDTILGKTLHDMDFALGENPTSFAKNLAKKLKAGFFVLDDERHTARVIYKNSQGKDFPLDFVQFNGLNLNEDLYNRDFTINAMAVPVDDLQELIDPLGGLADLEKGLLRLCSDHALLDDPVRVLRGVRLSIQFGFSFDAGLEQALQEAGSQLFKTAIERQRDELFRLLDGPDPAQGLEHYWHLGLFERLIPSLSLLGITLEARDVSNLTIKTAIRTVEKYHALVQVFTNIANEKRIFEEPWESVSRNLGKFSLNIETYLNEEIIPGRSKASLAYFGTLIQKLGTQLQRDDKSLYRHDPFTDMDDFAYRCAKELLLSNAESQWTQTLVQQVNQIHLILNACKTPDRRAIFRFFRKTGDAGIAIALLSLAETLAIEGSGLNSEKWLCTLEIVGDLFSAWWENHAEFVAPQLLLNGYDLQREFGLTPGKRIGDLLYQLEEEQASGNIANVEQAREFIRGRIEDLSMSGEYHES